MYHFQINMLASSFQYLTSVILSVFNTRMNRRSTSSRIIQAPKYYSFEHKESIHNVKRKEVRVKQLVLEIQLCVLEWLQVNDNKEDQQTEQPEVMEDRQVEQLAVTEDRQTV